MLTQDVTSTKIECRNTEVVKAFCEMMRMDYEEGANKAEIYKYYTVPFFEMKELSEQYPEEIIFCQFELGNYEAKIDIEFKGGVEHLIDYDPCYKIESYHINNENIKEKVREKTTKFFKKLDSPEINDEGQLYMTWSDDDVIYRFELESDDPLKRYRVEARKVQDYISMKVSKGNAIFEWVDLKKSDDGEDHVLPF